MAKSRGMDAVIEKSSAAGRGRKPALKRKGPGIAIMIALGKPKRGADAPAGPPAMTRGDALRPSKIAMLEARIEELEAKLAELDGESPEMADDEDEDEEDE
jgi:hypothetical protein